MKARISNFSWKIRYSKLRPTFTGQDPLEFLSGLLTSEKLVPSVPYSPFNTPPLGADIVRIQFQMISGAFPKWFLTIQGNRSYNQSWNHFFLNVLPYNFLNDSLHCLTVCLVRMILMYPVGLIFCHSKIVGNI